MPQSSTNNSAINGTVIGTSHVTGIGSGWNSPIHSHGVLTPANSINTYGTIQTHTIIDTSYIKNLKITNGNEEIFEVKDNAIKLNEIDKVDISELLSVFKYIKDEYPNLYADLILKGIIK